MKTKLKKYVLEIFSTWLDDFIFRQLRALYAPDFRRYYYNFDLMEEGNKKHFGTYFPRSYDESLYVLDNIFQNIKFQRTVCQKEILNILSVGCGTRGDLNIDKLW